jgi:hypothetical protein
MAISAIIILTGGWAFYEKQSSASFWISTSLPGTSVTIGADAFHGSCFH